MDTLGIGLDAMKFTSSKATSFAVAIVLLVSAAVQTWIVGSSTHWSWSGGSTRYSHLADGFLHGHLSLPEQPRPELLALANPYDPQANAAFREHDAILFEGKYYLYWGPAPAILLAAVCLPLGIRHPTIGDQWPTLVFMIGTVCAAAVLILQIHRRAFPNRSGAAAVIAVISLGLGAPILCTLDQPFVYQAAIAAGQFFLLAGFCAAFIGISGQRPRWFPLLMAGLFWALSAGSRISLAPAVAIIALLTAIHLWRFSFRVSIAALLAPLVIGAALFAAYNYARFHSIAEFGLRYQLTGVDQHTHEVQSASPWYVLPDLLAYLFTPPVRLNSFPYVGSSRSAWVTNFFSLPKDYVLGPIVGLLFSQPFLILAGLALRQRNWLTWSLLLAMIAAFLPPLTIGGYTVRYLVDVVPCWTVWAAIGFWHLLEVVENHRARRQLTFVVATLLVSVQTVLAFCLVLERPRMQHALPFTSATRIDGPARAASPAGS